MMTTEGFVPFRGMRTWYRTVGDVDSEKAPLLLIHGGPAGPSDAFEPLEALASANRAVVRYDQIGCGHSDRPADSSLWTIETFVEELAAVRRELCLDRVHLLGWSWGGMLATEYLLTKPAGVTSLILASSLASVPRLVEEMARLRAELPEHVSQAMRRFEDSYKPKEHKRSTKVAKGVSQKTMQRRALMIRRAFAVMQRPVVVRLASWASRVPFFRRGSYAILQMQLFNRYTIRRTAEEIPLSTYRTFAGVNPHLYERMWGPSDFLPVGTLKEWDVTSRLGEITVPTLITSGLYEETPMLQQAIHEAIPDSRWVLFEHSAHFAFVEEPDLYRATLEEFLETIEATTSC